MSVVRIDIPSSHTHGWQARWSCEGRRLTAFFADKMHGGSHKAWKRANHAEGVLRGMAQVRVNTDSKPKRKGR